jgi:hypothetical protein
LLNFRDRTPKRTDRWAIELLALAVCKSYSEENRKKFEFGTPLLKMLFLSLFYVVLTMSE